MGYFPMCVDLRGRKVLIVGDGPQTDEKMEKLRPFGAVLIRCAALEPEMLTEDIALVVAGDQDRDTAEWISKLCRESRIPVNVVDDPGNSTFFFPALVCRGDLTVGISTGGKAPGAAAYLSRKIARSLPDDLDRRLDALFDMRKQLYSTYPRETARRLLREAIADAFGEEL